MGTSVITAQCPLFLWFVPISSHKAIPSKDIDYLTILDLLDLDLIDVDGLEGDEDNWLTGPENKVSTKMIDFYFGRNRVVTKKTV